jgi:hypothetical protein
MTDYYYKAQLPTAGINNLAVSCLRMLLPLFMFGVTRSVSALKCQTIHTGKRRQPCGDSANIKMATKNEQRVHY